jgi:hypothetical protein
MSQANQPMSKLSFDIRTINGFNEVQERPLTPAFVLHLKSEGWFDGKLRDGEQPVFPRDPTWDTPGALPPLGAYIHPDFCPSIEVEDCVDQSQVMDLDVVQSPTIPEPTIPARSRPSSYVVKSVTQKDFTAAIAPQPASVVAPEPEPSSVVAATPKARRKKKKKVSAVLE